MITTKQFAKEVQSSDAELFRFTAGGGLNSSVTFVLENEDDVNSMTYKFQRSNDGETWTDLALPTGPSTTATSFVIDPATAHTVKLANTYPFYRIIARGSLRAQCAVIWFTRVDPATAGAPQILA